MPGIQQRLAVRQRVVLVIGLAVALLIFGDYLVRIGQPGFGWVAYAPLSRAVGPLSTLGLRPWLQLLIAETLTAIWTISSILILKVDREDGTKGRAQTH